MNQLDRKFVGCSAASRRRHSLLVLLTLLIATAAAGGCSDDSPSSGSMTPPPAASPTPTSAPDSNTVYNLLESGRVLALLAASPLEFATLDYSVWTTGPCIFGGGSLLGSLDGASVPTGPLPAGTHSFEVTFNNCLVDGLVGTSLSGTATAAYTSVALSDVTALVSASSTRGTLLALRSGLHDVTADGSGTWRRVVTGTGSTTTFTPTAGSRLVNNLTGNSATFTGGNLSWGYASPPPGSSASGHQDFTGLAVAINGIEYVLDGNLQSVYGFSGSGRHTGEVRITSHGTLVARVYGDANEQLSVEVITAVAPL